MTNICPNCGFPNDPGATVCRKCRHAYSASGADHTTLDIYASSDEPRPPEPSVPAPLGRDAISGQPGQTDTKLGLDFSDEAPPGEGPASVSSDLKREIQLDRRIARPMADRKAVAAADAAEAVARAVPGPGRHRAPSIVAIESLPASDPGKSEPSEMGAAPVFAESGPVAPGGGATPAPGARAGRFTPLERAGRSGGEVRVATPGIAVSAPGIPVHESWIEDSEPAKPLDLTAAGLIRRTTSAAIDAIILSAASAAVAWLGFVSFGTTSALTAGLSDAARAADALALPLVLLFAVTGGFYSLTFHFLGGRTIGKMVTGTRVITTAGKPVSLFRAFWRTACYLVTGVSLMIGFLWILVDERGQSLHDKLAGTYVIIDE
ncbi:MAG: RDD family protein [Deltaproteobacteria bacterium]|nr:RDD family protein [Deltaproteobacteria bacterium]